MGIIHWAAIVLLLATVCCLEPRGTSAAESPSFVNDVEPVLTRFGCNSGGCHGKLAGQNGFRLSLRGYAPEADHAALVTEEYGRRIGGLDSAESLLLLKATGGLPRGGGRLFARNSAAAGTLRAWIAGGAAGPVADERRVVAVSVTPKEIVLAPGEVRQLVARATWSDGAEKEVTALARFHSNDAAYATVSAEGVVRGEQHGEVAVVVSYAGLVDTVVISSPFPQEVAAERFASRLNLVDHHVMEKLQALHIPPADDCDDATFIRRLMLDLVGTLPAPEEVRSFLADTSPDKRALLVERLLERPEFTDFWTLQLSDLLQNRKERDHDVRGVKGVRSFHAWLRGQVAANRPWNELTRDLLTARDAAPAVGWWIVTVGEKQAVESEAADSAAQAFLGVRIGCARCHNHPLEKYTQDDYYHFTAFFSRVALDRRPPAEGATLLLVGSRQQRDLERQKGGVEQEVAKLVAPTGDGAQPADPAQIEAKRKQIEQLAGEIEKARSAAVTATQPRTGRQLPPQGLDRRAAEIAAGADPRESLAEWIVSPDNPAFAAAIVNRLWKHFFAVGLVEPVDDLRATNPPSNAPLLAALAGEFVRSGHDLRHVMRLLVNSRTYQLASDTTTANANDRRFHSHYYPRRLPAEVLADAIAKATAVPDAFAGVPEGTRAIQLPGPQADSYFLATFGRSDRVTACACERSGDVTLPQLLHLQNSDTILGKIRRDDGTLARLLTATAAGSADPLVEGLFLATVSRLPLPAERAAVDAALSGADRGEGASDLLWALLNAKEFTFNH
jgi:Protein of unknown function (DUF1549)/Protein of unknown function (DUF1553)/Bacterial Ig-like domain (group 2)